MKRITFIILIISTALGCAKQEIIVNTKDKSNIIELIESEKNTQNISAVSFCVVRGDSIIWSNALGEANKSTNTVATSETRFLIASISKTVTAVAAMKLAEKNILNLDADINKYLPFQVRNPNYASTPITARMLLNHSSSIADAHYSTFNFYCWSTDCPTPLGTFLQDFFDSNGQFYSTKSFLNNSPGSKGNYTNLGIALLGYIVERLANQPFDAYCKQNIFVPLGMTKTEWRLKNIPINELAVPYTPTHTSSKPHYTFPDYPNGGLRTTPTDLSKFMRMLMNNGSFNGVNILKPETINLMLQKTSSVGGDDFGLGLFYYNFKGELLVGHSGGELGTTTQMFFNKDKKVGAIVFANITSAKLDLIFYSLYKYAAEQ
jgi:CubicO group peptidase (beta-lactamase class C family)